MPPELSDLAPLRDLRRSQRLRDKRKELKNQTTGSSSDGSLNGAENNTINSLSPQNGENKVENGVEGMSGGPPPPQPPHAAGTQHAGLNDYLSPVVDALCKSMSELNHDVDCTPKNQLRV